MPHVKRDFSAQKSYVDRIHLAERTAQIGKGESKNIHSGLQCRKITPDPDRSGRKMRICDILRDTGQIIYAFRTESGVHGLRNFWLRFAKLMFGLILYGLGIVMTMKANLGFAPWDVFHQGTANVFGMTIGSASIAIGLIICIIVALAGEKLGLGTILNMLVIGVVVDTTLFLDIIPTMNGWIRGVAMMMAGLLVISLASYFYIDSGFGAGPRDSLMVVLERKTHLPVGVCRAMVEGSAVLVGWFLGGPVGFGTVLAAFGIGFCIQLVFFLLKFETTKVQHETLQTTLRHFVSR